MNKQAKIKLYAKALSEVIAEKGADDPSASSGRDKKIVNNFVKLLVQAGFEKKSKEILDLAESFLLAKQGKSRIIFETARNTTPSQKKILDGFVKKGDVVKEKINPELIAGIKIIINGSKQFDASMQSKLQKISWQKK
jgi:F0F1-type ATP synthase delta subunit